MEEPEPLEAPLVPDCETVQVKAVLPTLLVNVTEVTLPEHNVCELGVAVTDGIGFTVTVTTIGAPEHPAPVGVIV
jgi:hypothetical protein